MTQAPPPTGPGDPPDRPASDPEVLLGQALRAMAGGSRAPLPTPASRTPVESGPRGRSWSRFSTVQILLMAALVGLVVGVAAGLLTLL